MRRVIAPETAATVLEMMETVTGMDGTGRLAALQIPRGALTYAYDPDTGNGEHRRAAGIDFATPPGAVDGAATVLRRTRSSSGAV